MILVSIIEENRLAYDYLCQLLARDPEIRVVAAKDFSAGGKDCAEEIIFVIDQHSLSLPLGVVLRRLRLQFSNARFLLLGQNAANEGKDRLLWLGIHGVLGHEETGELLIEAVRHIHGSGTWIPSDVLDQHLGMLRAGKAAARVKLLTRRESEVLELARRRFSNKEIGEALGIREGTVKFHLGNIFLKLKASSRRDLVEKQPGGQFGADQVKSKPR